jgi:peptidoglycan/LPS O-acetylase OafA/YrhL
VIQRPQSLYLFATGILNLILFWTPIYSRAVADPTPWIGFGFAISLTIVMVTAIVAIFLYHNRELQLKVVKFATYIQIIAFGFATGILFTLGNFGTHLWREGLGFGMIVLVLIFLWLAGKGIKEDENLVKSMDRIR